MKEIKKIRGRGFTMIELIIVIAILGILSAFALPRFADFTTEAKASAREGVASSLNSAIAIAHAKWIANGSPTTSPITVILDGGTAITLNSSGYPDVSATGAYNSAPTCQALVNNLVSGSGSSLTVGYAGTNCTVDGAKTWGTPISLTAQAAN